jgi:hypothetical protein
MGNAVTKPKYRSDDIKLLLPTMQLKVQELTDALAAEGFDVVLFDSARTPEEAARNLRNGKGIANSIHIYGAAADLICGKHGWSCAANKCKLFTRLGFHAERLGFVWGGRFKRCDQPHVQGVKIGVPQNQMRRLGHKPESIEARDALVRAHFDSVR